MWFKKLFKISFYFFLFFVVLNLLIIFYLNSSIGHDRAQIRFEVKKSMSFKNIVFKLKKLKLIRSEVLAEQYGKLKIWLGYPYYYGIYNLSSSLSTFEIIDQFFDKNAHIIDRVRITFPEGYDLFEMADLLKEKELIQDQKEFLLLVNDKNFLNELSKKYNFDFKVLEGFLYPETYFFKKDIHLKKIIHKMIKTFWNKFPMEIYEKKKQELNNIQIHELITLASLIENESKQSEEKVIISSVFHNRLKKKMRLECDPTIIYALKKANSYKGNLSRKRGDLSIKSKYNTYLHRGLPPGPISNPSLESILAALNPADTSYLFFVVKDENSHFFSKTFFEHKKNVEKYKKWLLSKKEK